MKKFVKVMLIIAAVFTALGLGLSIGAAAMGASVEGQEIIREFQKHGMNAKKVWKNVVWFSDDDDEDAEFDGETVSADGESEDGTKVYKLDAAQKMEITLRSDTLSMEEWDEKNICVEVQNDASGNVKVASSSDKIEIKSTKKKSNLQVKVLYPKGMKFTALEIEVDVGSVYLESPIEADELAVSVGAGELYAYEEITARQTDMEVGAGNIELNLLDTKKLSGECGMGNLEFTLAGQEDDYYCDVECGFGNISVGKTDFSGVAGEHQWGSKDAGKEITLECGMGNISVAFQE